MGTEDLIWSRSGVRDEKVHGAEGGVVGGEVRGERGQVQGSKVRVRILAFILSETKSR